MSLGIGPKSIFRSYRGTNRATYLRGAAAIGVLTIHYEGLGLRELFAQESVAQKILNNLVDFGGQGPTIFFVASGFVLQKLFSARKRFLKFLLVRYFRLAPAYIVVSGFAIYTQGLFDQLTLLLAMQKVFFLDIFFSDAYLFNPLGIGFFVVIEFWLSFVLLLIVLLRKIDIPISEPVRIAFLVCTSFILSYFSGELAHVFSLESFQVELIKYQFFFLLGAVCYELKLKMCRIMLIQILLVCFGLSVLFMENFLGYIAAAISILFLLSEKKDSKLKLHWFLIAIGNVCYSIYLVHIPILRFFQANHPGTRIQAIAAIVVVVSVLIYLFVEEPFIRLGKTLVRY